jgi:hypothetical protein
MIFTQQMSNGLTAEQAATAAGMSVEDGKRLTVQEQITTATDKMGQALAGPLVFLSEHLGFIKTMLVLYGAIRLSILASNIARGFGLIMDARSIALGKAKIATDKSGIGVQIGGVIGSIWRTFMLLGPIAGPIAAAVTTAAVVGGIYAAIGDGEFPGAGKGPDRTIKSKGKMYEPHPTDNIYVTPQKMVAVGNASFKGNGGATNTSPNQFKQERRQERRQERQQERQSEKQHIQLIVTPLAESGFTAKRISEFYTTG